VVTGLCQRVERLRGREERGVWVTETKREDTWKQKETHIEERRENKRDIEIDLSFLSFFSQMFAMGATVSLRALLFS
jgi:uncharacterized protein YjaZ